jgi:cytochrome c
MKLLSSMLTAIALTVVSVTPALADPALAAKKACMACHGIDNKIVGPAFKDIGKRYKGQKGIEAKLAEKVMKGGKGAWGEVAMPANAQVTPDEAKKLVAWILALK